MSAGRQSEPLRRYFIVILILGFAPVRALFRLFARYGNLRGRFLAIFNFSFVELHSTRMLRRDSPKLPGRIGCTGIASKCKFVVDEKGVHRKLFNASSGFSVYVEASIEPEGIPSALLGCETLILAGRDRTFPRQIDKNAAPRSASGVAYLLSSPASSIQIENLDQRHPRLTALPTGVLPSLTTGTVRRVNNHSRSSVVRCPQVLSASRVREGAQWETRRRVRNLAVTSWVELCVNLDEEVTFKEYGRLLENFDFVLCPEGGGLDPSPKAWEAMLRGCIPIVRRTPTTDAYSLLPVIFVSEWSPSALTRDFLDSERHRIRRSFPNAATIVSHLSAERYRPRPHFNG